MNIKVRNVWNAREIILADAAIIVDNLHAVIGVRNTEGTHAIENATRKQLSYLKEAKGYDNADVCGEDEIDDMVRDIFLKAAAQ